MDNRRKKEHREGGERRVPGSSGSSGSFYRDFIIIERASKDRRAEYTIPNPMEECIEKMESGLTCSQRSYYEAVKWLVSERSRCSGRTTVLAAAFLDKAFNNIGHRIQVYDHAGGVHRRHQFEAIIGSINFLYSQYFKDSRYTLECNYTNSSIVVKRTVKE